MDSNISIGCQSLYENISGDNIVAIGESALKIEPGSVQQIEESIIKLFNEEATRNELSKKGRERMEELFDWEIAAKAYINLFEALIK